MMRRSADDVYGDVENMRLVLNELYEKIHELERKIERIESFLEEQYGYVREGEERYLD